MLPDVENCTNFKISWLIQEKSGGTMLEFLWKPGPSSL